MSKTRKDGKLSQIKMSDDEIIMAWVRYCKRKGLLFVQPSRKFERDKKYAYLTNCNGEIARFNLRNHRFEIGNN